MQDLGILVREGRVGAHRLLTWWLPPCKTPCYPSSFLERLALSMSYFLTYQFLFDTVPQTLVTVTLFSEPN